MTNSSTPTKTVSDEAAEKALAKIPFRLLKWLKEEALEFWAPTDVLTLYTQFGSVEATIARIKEMQRKHTAEAYGPDHPQA